MTASRDAAGPQVATEAGGAPGARRPHVSVVVPIYNVERYLTECLESLAGQTLTDLEVVMVDDGSTDSSAAIARAFSETDHRFVLVQQPNAGLGAARNAGADRATGDYVAFVDSDDVVLPRTYELLAGSLDRTGSDFASGNFHRLTTSGTRQAGMVFSAFNANRPRTHVSKHPALLNDRTAWNKLFRRSFWDAHSLRWPEGVLYEDIPVTLPAHVLARSVDVVRDPVYLWRARVGDSTSITQRRIEPRAIRDRHAAVDGVSRFLAAHGERRLKQLYDKSVAEQDLRYFLVQLDEADEEFQRLFLDLANDFFDRADAGVFDDLPSLQRLEWHLVRRRLLAELLQVLRYERAGEANTASFVRRRRAFYADYPFHGDPHVGVPEDVFRLRRDELPVPSRISDIWWDGDVLRLAGHAYIASLPMPSAGSGRLRLTLEETGHVERVVSLDVRPMLRPDVTEGAGGDISYDWSGFEASLPVDRLRHRGGFRTGSWRLRVELKVDGVMRRRWLAATEPGRATRPAIRTVAGARFVPTTPAGGFQLEVAAQHAVVETATLEGSVLELVGTVSGRRFEPGAAALRAAREDGRGATDLAVTAHGASTDDPVRIVSRVDLAALTRIGEVEQDDLAGGIVWQLHLQPGATGARLPLVAADGLGEVVWTAGPDEVRAVTTRTGRVEVVHRRVTPRVEAVTSTGDGVELAGTFAEPTGQETELVLTSRRVQAAHTVPVHREGDRFTAAVPVDAMVTAGGPLALSAGQWDVHARPVGRALAPSRVLVAPAAMGSLPVAAGDRTTGATAIEYADGLTVAVPEELAPRDRGRTGQLARRREAPALLRAPVIDQLLVDPYGPGRYADDARALHDALRSRHPGLDVVWTVERGRAAAPAGARPVSRGSAEWWQAVTRSRYVVAGDSQRLGDVGRRPRGTGQVVVQTWHGLSVDHVGLDDEDGDFHDGLGWVGRVRAEAARWDLLPAATPAHAAQLARAFDLAGPAGTDAGGASQPTGPIRLTGLPRHDVLADPARAGERESRAAAARAALALPDGRKVVLWAPSRRPRHAGDAHHFHLDLPVDPVVLAAGLGEDHVLVVRPHPGVVDTLPAADGTSVVDASWYADTADLLLAADVVVTDTSSLLWDGVLTRRPIVVFLPGDTAGQERPGRRYLAPDSLPGPVITEEEDLVAAIRSAPDSAPGPAYRAMQDALAPLADGEATSRVVDLMTALADGGPA